MVAWLWVPFTKGMWAHGAAEPAGGRAHPGPKLRSSPRFIVEEGSDGSSHSLVCGY